MGMKPPMNEIPLKIKGAVNNPSRRDANAPIRNSNTRKKTKTEAPIKNSIQKKQFGQ